MSRILFLLSLLAIISSAGCVTSPVASAQKFKATERAPNGYARLYIFRPGFSKVSSRDNPMLRLNDKEVFPLAYESYTSVTLQPGHYVVSLKSEFMESAVWNASAKLSVEADRTYFLAIWNNVEYSKGFEFVPIMGKTPFILPLQTDNARNTSVKFELVSENEAAPVLSELSYVPPLSFNDPRPYPTPH